MSDFYPSIHADLNLLEASLKGTKLTKEQQRIEKEKRIDRMNIVQKAIKQYNNHQEAERLQKLKMPTTTINEDSKPLGLVDDEEVDYDVV